MREARAKSKNELLPGTLEMLVLKTLSIESMHGYGIAQHIQMLSADVLTVEEGSLYPALQRMLVKGWVSAEWKTSANNRRARFYKLTAAGKKQLVFKIPIELMPLEEEQQTSEHRAHGTPPAVGRYVVFIARMIAPDIWRIATPRPRAASSRRP